MECHNDKESSPAAQPMLTYEGTVFAQATYRTQDVDSSPEATYIAGFDAIDAHTEQLLEQWETEQDLDAAIDALTIIESFPEHFDTLPPEVYDTLTRQIQAQFGTNRFITNEEKGRDFFTHVSQLPRVYRQIEIAILTQLDNRQQPLDEIIAQPVVGAFLDSYAEGNLPINRQGRVEALYQLLTSPRNN